MKKLLLVSGLTIVFIGCQKETPDTNSDENEVAQGAAIVEARLTNGGWKLTGVSLHYSNGQVDSSALDACKADDTIFYNDSGSAIVIHGPIPCSQDPVNGKYANWLLFDNGAVLRETYTRAIWNEPAGAALDYKVLFINTEKMVLSRRIIEPNKSYDEVTTWHK